MDAANIFGFWLALEDHQLLDAISLWPDIAENKSKLHNNACHLAGAPVRLTQKMRTFLLQTLPAGSCRITFRGPDGCPCTDPSLICTITKRI